jgi:hypothetical protein
MLKSSKAFYFVEFILPFKISKEKTFKESWRSIRVFLERFVHSCVPHVNYFVPDRARGALQNGILIFPDMISKNEKDAKTSFFPIDIKKKKQYFLNIFVL